MTSADNSSPVSIYRHLGRILAIVDHALSLQGGAVNNCLTMPKSELMGRQLSRALPAVRIKPWLESRMMLSTAAINVDEYQALQEPVPLVRQGDMLLVYHQERAALRHLEESHKQTSAGRPAQSIDWASVDWSLSDSALARITGRTRQAVWSARLRYGRKGVAPEA